MSRLRFLFAFVALFAVAATVAACGGDGGSGSDADPEAVIGDATLEGVESGNLDLSLNVSASGKEGGDITIRVSGPFQGADPGELPELDLTADVSGSASGKDIDFEGGLVLLPNTAFVNYQGIDYKVDPTTFAFVKSALKQSQKQGGAEEDAAKGCQEAVAETELGNFVDDLSNEASAEVEGVETTKVSGDLDVTGALDTVLALSEDPACANQLGAVRQLPSGSEVDEAREEVESAVKSGHADLYVGEDHIVRRFTAELTIAPEGSGKAPESVDLTFDLTLGGVNEPQEISAPTRTKPLGDLFLKLGVNPLELVGVLQGETEGLENLFESLAEGATEGASGGSSSGGGTSLDPYMECLQDVSSAADLQKCAALK